MTAIDSAAVMREAPSFPEERCAEPVA